MSYKVVGITMPNMTVFLHNLEKPDLWKSEGYRLPDGTPSYSPIDLSVALFQSYETGDKITNLKQWFISNPNRESEHLVRIYITYSLGKQGDIICFPVTIWKKLAVGNVKLGKVLKLNAPLTFNY